MNDAQQHVACALSDLERAIDRFGEAVACVKAQQLNDFDARALSVARTNAETAYLWAQRAVQS